VYCGLVEAGERVAGTVVAVKVGESVGVAVAVSVGIGVKVGNKVDVGDGVKLWTAGWKGVGVAVAFGSTVTRLRGKDEADGFTGRLQAVRRIVKMKSAYVRITACAVRNP